MSMHNKKSFFEKEKISKFSPLMQFFYSDLSVDEIKKTLLKFEKGHSEKISKEKFKSRLDEVISYVVAALDETFQELNKVLHDNRYNSVDISSDKDNFSLLNQAMVTNFFKIRVEPRYLS